MHLGSMATIGLHGPGNFKHIVINNGAHDSVGGQPTNALDENFDFLKIAQACGYKAVSPYGELSGSVAAVRSLFSDRFPMCIGSIVFRARFMICFGIFLLTNGRSYKIC